MKLIIAEEEVIEALVNNYDVEDEDARDAVIAAKVLNVLDLKKSDDDNAETIYADRRCW